MTRTIQRCSHCLWCQSSARYLWGSRPANRPGPRGSTAPRPCVCRWLWFSQPRDLAGNNCPDCRGTSPSRGTRRARGHGPLSRKPATISARRCARDRRVVRGQVAPKVLPDQPDEFGGDGAWSGSARQPLGTWVGNAVVGFGTQKR